MINAGIKAVVGRKLRLFNTHIISGSWKAASQALSTGVGIPLVGHYQARVVGNDIELM
jgi:uncharacterized membrane protein YoaT (DUF817 family)